MCLYKTYLKEALYMSRLDGWGPTPLSPHKLIGSPRYRSSLLSFSLFLIRWIGNLNFSAFSRVNVNFRLTTSMRNSLRQYSGTGCVALKFTLSKKIQNEQKTDFIDKFRAYTKFGVKGSLINVFWKSGRTNT